MAGELVLYDNRASSNARKVRFLLGELGLPYRSVEVPLTGERPEWYRGIHPLATVPALVDGDVVLVESNTILCYLAVREGRDDLYPPGAAGRARVDQLLDLLSLAIRPALWELELRTYYADDPAYSPGPPPAAQVRAARDGLHGVLEAWERLIEPGGYLTGAFSIADVAAAARLHLLPAIGVEMARFPRTGEMLATVGSRPAFRAAV